MANKTGWIFLVLGIGLLAALFLWLRPGEPPAAAATAAPAEPGVQAGAALPTTVQLVLKGGRVASGPTVVSVGQGDEVRLVVVSDHADDLHLHGYDLSVQLLPGVPAELRFTADRSGRFDYELHQAHAEIGVLEVQPK